MVGKHQKPQIEVPEEALTDQYVDNDAEDEQPTVSPPMPDTVSEVDWVDQQTDVPREDDDDYA